jgi:hypothetical protein
MFALFSQNRCSFSLCAEGMAGIISRVPVDGLLVAFQDLTLEGILQQSLVCRYFLNASRADDVWKPLCLARWPWLAARRGEEGWRKLFDKGIACECPEPLVRVP